MSIEDYNRHLDAQALQSHGKLSPSRELLEQLIDLVFRLDREVYLGVAADHRAGDISGYRRGYNPDGATNASGSLNLLPSQVSSSVKLPLYASTINPGQRSSCTDFINKCWNEEPDKFKTNPVHLFAGLYKTLNLLNSWGGYPSQKLKTTTNFFIRAKSKSTVCLIFFDTKNSVAPL